MTEIVKGAFREKFPSGSDRLGHEKLRCFDGLISQFKDGLAGGHFYYSMAKYVVIRGK